MGALTYRTYDTGTVASLGAELIAVHAEIYPEAEDPFHSLDRYREQLARHRAVPGWKLVGGHLDRELVGYAYGLPLQPGTRAWEGLLTPVPEGFIDEDGRRTFAVCELMVRAPWRRRGVARALHDELLSGRPEARAELLVRPDNAPAQAAYRSWGWYPIGQLRPAWEHAPVFDVMIKDLRGGGPVA